MRFRPIAAAVMLSATALPALAQTPPPPPAPTPVPASAPVRDATLTVVGTGEVRVAPDMATIAIGVARQADTAADAVRSMSADMDAVLTALATAGIATDDIQTSSLRVEPQMRYNEPTQSSNVTGYLAVTDVMVRVMDLTALGQSLDAVVQDGANQMNGITFDLADRKPALDEARRAAVADAAGKATLFAEAAGLSLGPVQSLTEGAASGGMPQPMMRMAMDSAEAVPVAAGQITIAADVTMIYGTSAD
ncbi:hypothetical protein SAMN04488003_11135 [Loktanella fryxellensis]|uniref:26 kDa periplasmic immunogenic protein n=1 Tax=Loktanella fryxellensis TaxID=245187 RepID=A0A1H8EMY1_9RHOB|nr:SIMPL domain-containing protein [Loktanella fryxellensis]SEN20802.1 hypothetical protein SAMN04488003_11135 [Loktanella fryxellensis]